MQTLRDYKLITGQEDFNTAIVDFYVDSTEEIPMNGYVFGFALYQGSKVYVINAGKFYVLNSEGEWHDSKDGAILVIT